MHLILDCEIYLLRCHLNALIEAEDQDQLSDVSYPVKGESRSDPEGYLYSF